MFNKLSLKSLGILFGVLLAIVVIYMIYDSSHGERSFKSEIVTIDTAKVTDINIFPRSQNHKVVRIFKKDGNWNVTLGNNLDAAVPLDKVQNLFSDLLNIKPQGVATSNESEWKNYQVDTTGTRVEVYQGNDKVLNLIVGKFAYQQPRTMLTYVRVGDDKNVYVSNGFLNYMFDHDANYFRDNTILNSEAPSWTKLTFTYPSDSSFTLDKQGYAWRINGQKTDSAETANYLNSISQLHNSNFVDNPDEGILRKAKYTVTIEGQSLAPIIISAYADSSQVIMNSSQNPKTFFDGAKNNYWHKLFVGKEHFFKKKK